jgi:acyl carrier protein
MALEHEVKRVLEWTFGLPDGSLADDAAFGQTEGWDSMGHVLLIGELERAFRISFSLNETSELTSVTQITRCLAAKGVKTS